MATPVEPAARALQRVRGLHTAGTDGLCTECAQTWPCGTMRAADGPPDSPIDNAINRVDTAMAVARAQRPATLTEFRRMVRDALDGPPPPTPVVQPAAKP